MRTVLLVGALPILGLVVLSTGPGRSFFQLEPLAYPIVITLGVIAATWTWAMSHIHRTRIVQRAIDELIPLAPSRGQLRRIPHRSAS
jgi:hypothetical protein